MMDNPSAQDSSNIGKPLQEESLPSWTQFPLREFGYQNTCSAGFIIDHYLAVFVKGGEKKNDYCRDSDSEEEDERRNQISLLTFNLQDRSVREADVKSCSLKISKGSRFLKYHENQLIQYCEDSYKVQCSSYHDCFMSLITIESFERILLRENVIFKNKALKIKCEEIKTEEMHRNFSDHTAQIYKDCFYLYGKTTSKGWYEPCKDELWCFDLKDRTWKLCKTTGEAPEVLGCPQSFIFEDCLCIYRARGYGNPLFMLDLSTMIWTKIDQEKRFLQAYSRNKEIRFSGTVYKDHFVVLANSLLAEKNALCFLNLHTKNTWSTFEIKGLEKPQDDKDNSYSYNSENKTIISNDLIGTLMVYKNLALSFAEFNKKLVVNVMNLDNFGIYAPLTAEEEHISSLFMNEVESDITLKVQDQLIPAHKRILMGKSQYFEKILNSGQDAIEIKDCEYNEFKQYLQFVYQGRFICINANEAIRLYAFAQKYLTEELVEKCVNYLSHNINKDNFYSILDFALQENIPYLKSWCLKSLRDNINIHNVAEMIKYLRSQELTENNKKFRNTVSGFILCHYFEIEMNEKGNIQTYEDFLLKNIGVDVISVVARFLSLSYEYEKRYSNFQYPFEHFKAKEGYPSPPKSKSEDQGEITIPKTKDLFDEKTMKLKEAALSFINENMKNVMTSQILKDFPSKFLRDFTQYSVQKARKQIQDVTMELSYAEINQESQENSKGNEKKRIEIKGIESVKT